MINSLTIKNIIYPVLDRNTLKDNENGKPDTIYYWKKGDDKNTFFKCDLILSSGEYFDGISDSNILKSDEKLILEALSDLTFLVEEYFKDKEYLEYLKELEKLIENFVSFVPQKNVNEVVQKFQVEFTSSLIELLKILQTKDLTTKEVQDLIKSRTNILNESNYGEFEYCIYEAKLFFNKFNLFLNGN